jgi:hypothetical protein
MPMPKHLEGKAVSIMKQPNRGKGGGRKPKIVKKWVKEANLSKADAQAILLKLLAEPPAQINEKIKTEYNDMSALSYGFLMSIKEAYKKGNFTVIKQMMDFLWGSEQPQTSITQNQILVDLRTVILQRSTKPKERERIIGELEKITGYKE